jgi:chemotaxis protein methyltransferase CheR
MNAQAAEREYMLGDAEFDRLRRLVHLHTGIALSDTKRELVYGRLSRRLRTLGLASFADYCRLIESGHPDELQELTNAITTNLTSFFRENHHFDQLARETLPQIMRAQSGKRRLRLWSAGCSTGEEPYSLAIVLREAAEQLRNWDVKLLATDIDSNVLATAAAGVYRQDRFEGEPAPRLKRWFTPAPGRPGFLTASAELKSLITFKQLNLLSDWPMRGPFDVIFCRNVVIYFNKDTQRELFARMAALQAPGSWLFVGHSENLHTIAQSYKLTGRTIYRRVD